MPIILLFTKEKKHDFIDRGMLKQVLNLPADFRCILMGAKLHAQCKVTHNWERLYRKWGVMSNHEDGA